MRAVVIRSYGGPDVLEIVEVPTPEPGRGQVRVRVEAAGVNIIDAATREGWIVPLGLSLDDGPVGLGWDVAGVVDAVGSGPSAYAPGDRVVGLSDRLNLPTKAYAEQIVLDVGAVAKAPSRATAPEAATLPLNGLTALQSLDLLRLEPGQSLLVTGAAGGVGGFAVELGRARGLEVVASAGDGDEAAVRALGADHFVPRSAPLGEAVREVVPGGVDGALDAAVVGPGALEAVRGGGAFVAVRSDSDPAPLRGTRVHAVFARAEGAQLARLSAMVDAGALSLRVADVLPLDDVALAHKRLDAGRLRGRLVLVP